MKLKLVKSVYWIDFRDPGGRRHRLSTGVALSATEPKVSEASAYKAAAAIVSQYMEAGAEPEQPVVIVPALAVLLRQRLDNHWQHLSYGKTMRYTVQKLVREVGCTPCASATMSWWNGEKARWLKEGIAVSTINRYANALKGALGPAKDAGHIKEVPSFTAGSERKLMRERYMLDSEEPRILEWLTKMQGDDVRERRWEWEYLFHLCVLLIDTGFRFSEAYEFTIVNGHADLDAAVSKGGRGRRIPLTSRALKAAEFLLSHPHHAWLHVNTTYARPKTAWDWCSHRLERCFRALEINKPNTPARLRLTMHCFRHTCASRLLNRGVNMVVVSRWLGHSSIQITMRYLKLERGAFEGAVSVLESEPRTALA